MYKGVVFNEMKGVYSQPDSMNGTLTQQALFPDNSYAVDSGGNPSIIPDLTFEEFRVRPLPASRRAHRTSSRFLFDLATQPAGTPAAGCTMQPDEHVATWRGRFALILPQPSHMRRIAWFLRRAYIVTSSIAGSVFPHG